MAVSKSKMRVRQHPHPDGYPLARPRMGWFSLLSFVKRKNSRPIAIRGYFFFVSLLYVSQARINRKNENIAFRITNRKFIDKDTHLLSEVSLTSLSATALTDIITHFFPYCIKLSSLNFFSFSLRFCAITL